MYVIYLQFDSNVQLSTRHDIGDDFGLVNFYFPIVFSDGFVYYLIAYFVYVSVLIFGTVIFWHIRHSV